MDYTFFQLAFLFFSYSFLGWCAETIVASAHGKNFANRGFATGPFCFIYGFSGTVFALTADELVDSPVFLFLGCAITATLIEWSAAKLLERMNRKKWWDYSHLPFNLDGYVCLPYSALWGALGCCAVLFGNRLLVGLYDLIPALPGRILIYVLLGIGATDGLVSLLGQLHLEHRAEQLFRWNERLQRLTLRLGEWLAEHMGRRIHRAYPITRTVRAAKLEELQPIPFLKLVWLFTVACFLGDIAETIFCRFKAGVWMSRSSLVWGPFSVVWGGALLLATILLHRNEDRSDFSVFLLGTVAGGAYEYICSVLSEKVFGAVFWDYSKIPFNLGGRINLLYCFFWGIAAVLWVKKVYPLFSKGVDWLLEHLHPLISWGVAVFMALNMVVSAGALVRYTARSEGIEASSQIDEVLDECFGDERMEQLYPNILLR